MTSTTTSFINRYESDSDSDYSDSEDEIIQIIPDKFKNIDFSVKETSNTTSQLSTNITRWTRNYEQKYINRRTSTGKPRVRPIVSTNSWTKSRVIVLRVKYFNLSDFPDTLYKDLDKDDLVIVLTNRDEKIRTQSSIIRELAIKVSNLKSQLSYAWAQVYKRNN